ncbi:MAG: tail fiber domain-containing protein [Bacteroidetes bacterium]|nr:tail fiber domain-containing protein [Bacteroidota bacterium]
MGVNAGIGNTTGQANTFIGTGGSTTPAITGGFNSMLGNSAGISAGNISFSTAIGFGATANADFKVRLGGTTATVIEGQVAYSFPSDGRFKTNVKEDVPGLEFINKLRPVTYNFETQKFDEFLHQNDKEYKANPSLFIKSSKIKQSGFIAQEVEKVAKELGYDFNGVHAPESANDNYSMSYELLIVPMVKGMQELSKENQELKIA